MTKILLVEDDKNLREIYGVRLLAEGYDIVSAGDGEEALAMAIKERPQLIVSDVMMPKISGFDMLDILRSTTETKGIKVIIMTALSSEDQRARGESLGADRYLVKSQVGIEDVVRAVHEVLGDTLIPARPAAAPAQAAPTPVPSAQPVPMAQVPTPAPTIVPAPARPAQPAAVPPARPVTSVDMGERSQKLGDRVINPLPQTTPVQDIGELINQELNSNPSVAPMPTAAPEAPAMPIMPTPPVPPVAPIPPQQPIL